MLGVARLAAHPQKTVLQPAALQEIFELTSHITRQFPALFCHERGERWVMLVNDLIEKGLLGSVTLVANTILMLPDVLETLRHTRIPGVIGGWLRLSEPF